MMNLDPQDKFKVPGALWRGLAVLGLTPAAVLRQARLPATVHLDDKARLTTREYFALWRAIEDLNGDPCLGIALVERLDTATLPPSSLVAFYARDYRDGLHRTFRFKQLCSPEFIHMVEEGGDCTITVEWPHATEDTPSMVTEATFASFVELGRRGTGIRLLPRRIDFTRSAPPGDRHQAYFGCPIRYTAPCDALVLDVADLDRPFPGHNPELLEILTPALASALGELNGRSSTSDRVKVVLKRTLPSGRPDIGTVARELGMSERTLQRRITDEGSSFRQLLTQARQDLVRHYLAEPSIDVGEVAFLLGYEDANSFYRAFRTWEGTTPARWRDLRYGPHAMSAGRLN